MNDINTLSEIEKELLSKKNVVAIGNGNKWTNGQNTGEKALLIFVSKKESLDKLSENDKIPSKINNKITDVVGKSGEFLSMSLIAKIRPIKPGYSIGHVNITAGTCGGFFIDRNGDVIGLSNNHVLANINNAKKGDPIVQPGVYDNRLWSNNIVGTLKNYRELVDNYWSFDAHNWRQIWGYNLEDSAVFCPTVDFDTSIPNIGEINDFRLDINVDETVQKTGRTTGYMTGKVIATDVTSRVSYGNCVLTFKDQIATTAMSQGGDSGSLLLDMNRNVVGLLFAGSNTITLHNNIKYPKATYGLKICRSAVNETTTLNVLVNDQLENHNYTLATISEAAQYVRAKALSGVSARLMFDYSAQPI